MNDAKSSDDQIHKQDTRTTLILAIWMRGSVRRTITSGPRTTPIFVTSSFNALSPVDKVASQIHIRMNCALCDDMFEDGIADITCIDLSATAVKRMHKRLYGKVYKGIKELKADVLDLPFPDEQYDVVEKGTMDVLFMDSSDPWNPHLTTVSKVMQMLREPHFRRPLFESREFSWSVGWSTSCDGFHYFFYTLKKGHLSLAGDVPKERLEVPSISLLHEKLEGEDYLF